MLETMSHSASSGRQFHSSPGNRQLLAFTPRGDLALPRGNRSGRLPFDVKGHMSNEIPEIAKRVFLSNSPVILCVDDEVVAVALRRLVLLSAGYQVVTAADGAAALELFRCIQVDLVITDHWLPGLMGAQLGAEMKRLKPAIPIILFSGLPEAPPGSEYADLYITKGMPAVEFLRAVAKQISNSQSSDGIRCDGSSSPPG